MKRIFSINGGAAIIAAAVIIIGFLHQVPATNGFITLLTVLVGYYLIINIMKSNQGHGLKEEKGRRFWGFTENNLGRVSTFVLFTFFMLVISYYWPGEESASPDLNIMRCFFLSALVSQATAFLVWHFTLYEQTASWQDQPSM